MAKGDPRSKTVAVTTPFGPCEWTFVSDPDQYGNFKTTVLLDPEQAAPIIEQLEEITASYKTVMEAMGKKVDEVVSPCIQTDREDGLVGIRFKKKAFFESKSGQKVASTVPIVDAKTNPVPKEVRVFSGSILRANGMAKADRVTGTDGVSRIYGSIVLKSVQVKEFANPDDRFVSEWGEVEGADVTAQAADDASMGDV